MSTHAGGVSGVSEVTAPLTIEELKARWKVEKERAISDWRAGLRRDDMLALACVPAWTASLARRVQKWPELSRLDLAGTHARGQLEEIRPPLEEDQTDELIRYVMTPGLRAQVYQEHAGDPLLRNTIWAKIQRVATALRSLEPLPGDPEESREWAELVAPATSTLQLVDRIDGLVRDAESSSQIHRVLSLAKGLEPLLVALGEAPFDVTMLRGGRRIELLHRSEDDRVHLQHFQLRGDQLNAVRALVADDNEHWALHLVGAGGVGKTTLLRYISSDFAKGRYAVARVDFDYLNPDYPRLAPGMLLWAFGQDLRAYGERRFDELLKEADRILDKLHQQIRADVHASASLIQHPDFLLAVNLYVEALQTLKLRVLLILDTCEELARTRPDGTVPESVRDTFGILDLLHKGLPTLRVILSGRRPLAKEGLGWHCVEAPAGLPPRKFLRLHEVRGFSHERSRTYLAKAGVPRALHDAILQRCAELGSVMKVEWHDTARKPKEVPRCNPYDLRLYAEWASEKPAPDATTIANSTAAQYVQFRILRRLRHSEFERLLPVIATLGHIDDDTLRHLASDTSEDSFAKLQRAIRQQEWTSVRSVVDPDASDVRHVYGIETGICERLRKYFGQHPQDWSESLHKACRYLVRKTMKADLGSLEWTDFDATFNALCATGKPKYVARWWQAVERRFAERGPEWTRDLLKYLQGSQDTSGKVIAKGTALETDIAQKMRPAILAAYATAVTQSDRYSPAAADIWSEVLGSVQNYPLRRVGKRLRLRAAAGRLASAGEKLEASDFELVASILADTPPADIDFPCLIGLVRAAGNLLDQVELADIAGQPLGSLIDARVAQLVQQFDKAVETYCETNDRTTDLDAIAVWMRCLLGRASARAQQLEAAKNAFSDALERLHPDLNSRHLWIAADESPSLMVRVHLEYGRVAYPLWSPPAYLHPISAVISVPKLLELSPEHCPIDLDRVAAVLLRVLGAMNACSTELLPAIRAAMTFPPRAGRTAAQRCVPPLCCVAAEELAEYGLVDEAVGFLKSMLLDTAQHDEEIRRELERSYLRLSLRFRLFEAGHGTVESLKTSKRPADDELMRLADAMHLPANETAIPSDPRALHAAWRSLVVAEPSSSDTRKNLKGWLEVLSKQRGIALALDALECELLLDPKTDLRELMKSRWKDEYRRLSGDRDAASINGSPVLYISSLLRAHALSVIELRSSDLEWIAARLGSRSAAELALDEATALALRLPRNAEWLAGRAARWFEDTSDTVGTLRAVTVATLAARPAQMRDRSLQATRLEALGRDLSARVTPESKSHGPLPDTALWKPWEDRFLLISGAGSAEDQDARSRRLAASPELREWVGAEPVREMRVARPSPVAVIGRWAGLIVPAAGLVVAFSVLSLLWIRAPGDGPFDDPAVVRPPALEYPADAVASIGSALLEFVILIPPLLALVCAWVWRQWFVPRWLRFVCKIYAMVISLIVILLSGLVLVATPEPGEAFLSVSVAALILGYSVWRAVRYVRVLLANSPTLRMSLLEIEPDPTSAQPGIGQQAVHIALAPVAKVFVPFSARAKWENQLRASAGSATVGQPYVGLAQSFEPKLQPIFQRMRKLLGLRRSTFALRSATPEEHAWPAEAIVFLNAGTKANSTRAAPFLFRRMVELPPSLQTSERKARQRELIAPKDCVVDVNALGGLREELHEGTWHEYSRTSSYLGKAPDDHSSARVLHLVGNAHHDSSGLRFHLRKNDPGDAAASTESGAPQMLRAEDVAVQSPGVTLCIVQGQARSSVVRGDSDRRRAGLARVFAARLSAHGIPMVIVVPPLPRRLAGKVAREIADYAGRCRPHQVNQFLKMIDDLRHLISSTLSVSVELREQDLLDPAEVARRLLTSTHRANRIVPELTKAGERRLKDWEALPREALIGLLLEEINPILRRADLLDLCCRRLSLRRLARWLAIGTRNLAKSNRAVLSSVLGAAISDGKESARQDAWELALDVCGFCAESRDMPIAKE